MKPLNIKFTDYFDKIYIINLVNRTERREFVENELKAIGIYDELVNSGKLEWVEAIRLPLTQKVMDCMYLSGDVDFSYADKQQKLGQFMCTSEHYRVIKKSIYKGYNRILVLEDDICIMKNFAYIMKALEQAPDDFKLLHFEGFYWPISEEDRNAYLDVMTETVEDGYWVPSEQMKLWCTAALAYSREGMEEYCGIQEEKFISPDHPTFWMLDRAYAYSYPLMMQESKVKFSSDIVGRSENGIEDVNVYLTYYDYNNYYHDTDFVNED